MKVPLQDVVVMGTKGLQDLTGLALSTVAGAEPLETGWRLQVELVEKESIPRSMDVLGLYDVWMDADGHLLRFARRSTRRRSDVSEES